MNFNYEKALEYFLAGIQRSNSIVIFNFQAKESLAELDSELSSCNLAKEPSGSSLAKKVNRTNL